MAFARILASLFPHALAISRRLPAQSGILAIMHKLMALFCSRIKISRLQIPRHQGVVPVLFHIGGVTDSVIEQDYFYKIVDLSSLISCEHNELGHALESSSA